LLNEYEIRAAGGGSRSDLWTQIVTDVCHREQKLTTGSVRAPAGSAFLAGRAVDLVSVEDLQEWVGFRKIVSVQPDTVDAYDCSFDRFMRYLRLLAQNGSATKQ
jgi:xylulokinase